MTDHDLASPLNGDDASLPQANIVDRQCSMPVVFLEV